MNLGTFSISLAVKDLAASIAFYQDLGFQHFGGTQEHGYAIVKQGDTLIGLFQGMFEQNILTFNPGWDSNAQTLDPFDDVRDIAATLRSKGYALEQDTTSDTAQGPASFVVKDPDGNPILVDQHRS